MSNYYLFSSNNNQLRELELEFGWSITHQTVSTIGMPLTAQYDLEDYLNLPLVMELNDGRTLKTSRVTFVREVMFNDLRSLKKECILNNIKAYVVPKKAYEVRTSNSVYYFVPSNTEYVTLVA